MSLLLRPLLAALCATAAAATAASSGDSIVRLSKELLSSHPHAQKGHVLVLHGGLGAETIQSIISESESQVVILDGIEEKEDEATAFFDHQTRSVLALATSAVNGSAKQVPSLLRSLRQASHKDINLFTEGKEFDHSQLPFPTNILQSLGDGLFSVSVHCPQRQLRRDVNFWMSERSTFVVDMDKCRCPYYLEGRKIRVSARGLPPFNLWRSDGSLYGVDHDLLTMASIKLGFTFGNIVTEPVTGSPVPGTGGREWIGVVGAVKNGTSAIGVGNLALDPARYSVIDYTTRLYSLNTGYISPKPKRAPGYQNVLKPFRLSVWMFTIASLVVITFVLYVTIRGSPSIAKYPELQLRGMFNAILFPLASLLKQDVTDNMTFTFRPSPTAVLLSTLWLWCSLLLTMAYQSNLRAFLVAVDYDRAIDSSRDLLELDRKLYLPKGTSVVSSMRDSPSPDHQALFKSVEEKDGFFYLEKGWLPKKLESEMLETGDALLFPSEPVKMKYDAFQKEFGRQPFRVGKVIQFIYHAGWIVAKNTQWKSELNLILERLVEGGIVEKLSRNYYPLRAQMEEPPENASEVKFTFDHTLAAFIVLMAGAAVAAVAFAATESPCAADKKTN